jgi:hypothetical protein
MAIYRRFLRAKKGMSTIFGALFFIILVLMGFNLIWNFVQYDSYNQVISKMSQRDQLTTSENLVVTQPGVVDCCAGNGFNITVTNLGGAAITISRIYINNVNPTGQCTSSPCVADPSGTPAVSNGNIQLGELNHKIKVSGISVNDGNAYRIVLASTRGRLFSFYYPWPVTVNNNNGGGSFVTNIGPLSVYFDFKSFNFTQGAQTQSQSAFCVPSSTTMVLWVKLANTATDSSVTLQGSTMMQMQPYSANGFGQFVRTWVVSPTSINPSSITPYNQGTNPYTLPAATANGPSSSVEVYFGGSSQGGTGGVSLGRDDNWLTFIGFYYNYRNQPQGETIPFMDLKSTAGYPGTC